MIHTLKRNVIYTSLKEVIWLSLEKVKSPIVKENFHYHRRRK